MPLYLSILLAVLVGLSLVLIIYLIICIRRITIATKKVDYLVEDITYKSEMLNPLFESLLKVSNIIDGVDSLIKQKTSTLIKHASDKKQSIMNASKSIKDIIGKFRKDEKNKKDAK